VLPGPGTSDTYGYVGTSETVARISNLAAGVTTNTDSIVSATGDRIGVKVGSTVNWLLPDLHSNTGASLSADEAAVTNAIRYDAYGMTLATGRPGTSPGPVGEKAWTYQGRLDISPEGLATPLYDMGARFYAPGLGTFTQLDTVAGSAQDPLSMNRFLYAQGNPATMIDPDGHAACSAYADYCATNGSTARHTVQNTARHTGKLRAGQSGRSWLNQRRDRDAEGRVTSRRVARSAATRSPTMSWRDRYKGVLADYNSRLTPRDEMAEEVRTHEARTGLASRPWTVQDAVDTLSYFPVIGTPADIASAIGYGSKGDWGNAGLAILSILPIGDALRLGKAGVKGGAEAVSIGSRYVDDVAAAASMAEDVKVYRSFASDGSVNYVGITNDIDRRTTEHLGTGKGISPVSVAGLGSLSRLDARAVEQAMINNYRLKKNGGSLINQINSISTKNADYDTLITRGTEILDHAGFEW